MRRAEKCCGTDAIDAVIRALFTHRHQLIVTVEKTVVVFFLMNDLIPIPIVWDLQSHTFSFSGF